MNLCFACHVKRSLSQIRISFQKINIESLCVEGMTCIGRDDAPVPQDITIEGPGIEAEHCKIENKGGIVILDPCGHLCSLDGVPVTRPTQLTQGNHSMSSEEDLDVSAVCKSISHIKTLQNIIIFV